MKSTVWVALAIALTAFAGCTEKAEPTLTEEDCEALGLVLGHKEVMDDPSADGDEAMDGETSDDAMAGNETGEESQRFTLGTRQANETEEPQDDGEEATDDMHQHMSHGEELACVPAGPPAVVSLTGMPESLMAYSSTEFTWTLNTESADEMHTMDTQVRVHTESVAVDLLGMPATYGEQVVQFEHQNFFDGQSYGGTFSTDVPGTYYFRAFALVNQENLWSEEVVVEVTEVMPTGVTESISCNNGGAQSLGSCSPSDLTIELGDAVEWLNGNQGGVGSWTIHKVSGPDGQEVDTTAGGDAVVFLVPGSYVYEADGDLGAVEGSINVSLPSS